jgi:threonine dehydratase
MWPLLSSVVSDSIVVTLAEAADAMKFAAERCHVVAEGAAPARLRRRGRRGCRRRPPQDCRGRSGGNIDLSRLPP